MGLNFPRGEKIALLSDILLTTGKNGGSIYIKELIKTVKTSNERLKVGDNAHICPLLHICNVTVFSQ
jgi:hypothetical protein